MILFFYLLDLAGGNNWRQCHGGCHRRGACAPRGDSLAQRLAKAWCCTKKLESFQLGVTTHFQSEFILNIYQLVSFHVFFLVMWSCRYFQRHREFKLLLYKIQCGCFPKLPGPNGASKGDEAAQRIRPPIQKSKLTASRNEWKSRHSPQTSWDALILSESWAVRQWFKHYWWGADILHFQLRENPPTWLRNGRFHHCKCSQSSNQKPCATNVSNQTVQPATESNRCSP